MAIPKGGRGKKAPYETQQMRVPVPIKDQVNSLIAKFRGEVLDDNNLLELVSNSHLLPELESSRSEIKNLKTALQEANQQIENLSTALIAARSEIQNLYTSLEEEKQKSTKLNTDKTKTDLKIDHKIGEGEALKRFNLERRILRSPREKGETKVNFKHEDKFIYLEYIGQPDGKGSTHYWKITKVEEAPKNLSLAI